MSDKTEDLGRTAENQFIGSDNQLEGNYEENWNEVNYESSDLNNF